MEQAKAGIPELVGDLLSQFAQSVDGSGEPTAATGEEGRWRTFGVQIEHLAHQLRELKLSQAAATKRMDEKLRAALGPLEEQLLEQMAALEEWPQRFAQLEAVLVAEREQWEDQLQELGLEAVARQAEVEQLRQEVRAVTDVLGHQQAEQQQAVTALSSRAEEVQQLLAAQLAEQQNQAPWNQVNSDLQGFAEQLRGLEHLVETQAQHREALEQNLLELQDTMDRRQLEMEQAAQQGREELRREWQNAHNQLGPILEDQAAEWHELLQSTLAGWEKRFAEEYQRVNQLHFDTQNSLETEIGSLQELFGKVNDLDALTREGYRVLDEGVHQLRQQVANSLSETTQRLQQLTDDTTGALQQTREEADRRREVAAELSGLTRQVEQLQHSVVPKTELEQALLGLENLLREKLEGMEQWRESIHQQLERLRNQPAPVPAEPVVKVEPPIELLERLNDLERRQASWQQQLAELSSRREEEAKREPVVVPVAKAELSDAAYFLFEEKFRGPEEQVRERQRQFVPLFQGGQHVLDLGCGRGEFLDLLREAGIGASGIDKNQVMVALCQRKGLRVSCGDIFAHLEAMPDDTLDGAFAGQLIEHLTSGELVHFLRLMYRRLKYHSPLVLETPNPLNLPTAATHFNTDLSHQKPITPDLLQFLLEQTGFRNPRLTFFSLTPESEMLQSLPTDDRSPHWLRDVEETFNQNVQKLNNLLCSYRDYAAVAYK